MNDTVHTDVASPNSSRPREAATGAARRARERDMRRRLSLEYVRATMNEVLGEDMHVKQVQSLANGVAGVLGAAVMSIHAIGQAYALAAKIDARSGVKQVDRLLSNIKVDLATVFPLWIGFVLGARKDVMLAMDWTEFDDDDHSTLCAYVITRHGRATPLYWKTIRKSEMAGNRTRTEHEFIEQLHSWIPTEVAVTLLADRGFGDQKLYELLTLYHWDFVIRFRGNILVESEDGETRPAAEWAPGSGRARKLQRARVTGDRALVPAVVVVHARRMKECWALATSLDKETASAIVKRYGRRFSIEETFRDTKDLHFGMGLKLTHIGRTDRRDRILFLFAVAHTLLTLLGAASEAVGFDRKLKVNTVKKRTHSLYRQGLYWYGAIPTMREDWLATLMTAFDRIVREQAVLTEALGFV